MELYAFQYYKAKKKKENLNSFHSFSLSPTS